MHVQFKLLGLAGLIPFVFLPPTAYFELVPYLKAYTHFVQYSAVILSFFGGVHWFNAISENKINHQVYVAMFPSIVAWLSLVFLDGKMLLMVLSLGYIAILMYDKFTLKLSPQMIVDYTKLRVMLTSVVVLSHLGMSLI